MKNLFSNVQRAVKVASEVTAKTVKDVSKSTKAYSDIYKSKNNLEALFGELGKNYYEDPNGDFTELLEKIAAEKKLISELEESLNEKEAVTTEEVLEEGVENEDTESEMEEQKKFFQALNVESLQDQENE